MLYAYSFPDQLYTLCSYIWYKTFAVKISKFISQSFSLKTLNYVCSYVRIALYSLKYLPLCVLLTLSMYIQKYIVVRIDQENYDFQI